MTLPKQILLDKYTDISLSSLCDYLHLKRWVKSTKTSISIFMDVTYCDKTTKITALSRSAAVDLRNIFFPGLTQLSLMGKNTAQPSQEVAGPASKKLALGVKKWRISWIQFSILRADDQYEPAVLKVIHETLGIPKNLSGHPWHQNYF